MSKAVLMVLKKITQTNECGKRNTELKDYNKKTYGELVNLAADKRRRGDLETWKQESSANYLYC